MIILLVMKETKRYSFVTKLRIRVGVTIIISCSVSVLDYLLFANGTEFPEVLISIHMFVMFDWVIVV